MIERFKGFGVGGPKRRYQNKQKNTSPINFFLPNKDKFQYYKNAAYKMIFMKPGDCVFIPAFYFYQMEGSKNPHIGMSDAETVEDVNKATAVSLKFGANSELLQGFFEAVEAGYVK